MLNVCTYNVRTLKTEDYQERIIDAVDQINWVVIGLCET